MQVTLTKDRERKKMHYLIRNQVNEKAVLESMIDNEV